MKKRIGLLLSALLLCSLKLCAQASPWPTISGYAGSEVPDTTLPMSSFCKGGMITVHGTNFFKTAGGEQWDTTRVLIGGLSGNPVLVTRFVVSSSGNSDTLFGVLPDIYPADTVLTISVVKTTTQGSFPFTYTVSDSVVLRGDWVRVTYPAGPYCLGAQNPIPAIALGPSTSGTFCCAAGASGFVVLASGEIPLHQGAVGANTFQYQTSDNFCPDTLKLSADITPTNASLAAYGGNTNFTICKDAFVNPVSDTASLVPAYGSGYFACSGGGLVFVDTLTGEIDVQASTAGVYVLQYIPLLDCHDTATVNVTISDPATAQVIYPDINQQGNSHHLCTSEPGKSPAFLSGQQGGTFWSVPAGVAFGQVGQIIPGQTMPGSYAVYYRPPGTCVDTATVLAQLVVDTTSPAVIGFSQFSACAGDTLRLDTLSGNIHLEHGTNTLYNGPAAALTPASVGLIGGEIVNLSLFSTGPCPDTVTALLLINPAGNAAFAYPSAAYCLSDPDPVPATQGQGGGTFAALTTATRVDTATGKLDLTGSGAGTHKISYTTPGSCPATDSVTVLIFGTASAQFAYATSQFCTGEADPTPTIGGAPGGVFTSDSTLAIDANTGTIDLDASAAGVHNVRYTLSGGCNTFSSQTIEITGIDSMGGINYARGQYCSSDADPRPLISGDSAGTFIGTQGLVWSVRDSGIVDLSGSQPGMHVVTLDLDNRCATDPADTFMVLVRDDAYFSYPSQTACSGGDPLLLDSVAMPGGVFRSGPGGLQIDLQTGTVDASASLPGGPYAVTYTTSGPCPDSAIRSVSILPRPQGVVLQSHPAGTICQGNQITLRAVATGATDYSFFLNGNSVSGLFDWYQTDSLHDGDSLACVLTNGFGCMDTVSMLADVAAVPRVLFGVFPRTVARGDPVEIRLGAYVDGTVYDYSVSGRGAVEILEPDGQTFRVGAQDVRTIRVQHRITNSTDPAYVTVDLLPRAGECIGEAETVEIEVLPSSHDVFVPEVMTPNGDGHNDTWEVHWLPHVNPDDYELRLYNRGGGQVAKMRPLHNGFDGAALPDGVYWWSLVDRGGEAVQAGGLTIRRR